MTCEFREGILYITLPDRVDAANAASVEAEIEELIRSHEADKIIFDADNLEYISSAGLRLLLKLIKRKITLSVVNLSDYVYEIFEMTGYDNLISIEKKETK